MAALFEVLAEPHRRSILDLLRESERSVTDLVGVLDVSLKNRDAALEQYAVLKTLDTEVANRLFNMIFRTSVVRAATLSLRRNR